MAKSKSKGFDIVLFLITLFLGWFGMDKLYVGGRKVWRIALVKFLLNLVGIGEIWNIYDLVCEVLGRYKLNPLK